MANNKEWAALIVNEIQDGQWFDYPKLVAKLRVQVPPGYGFRIYEKHYPTRKMPADKGTVVAIGQSLVIRKAIYNLYKTKKVEIEYVNNEHKRKAIRRIRLI